MGDAWNDLMRMRRIHILALAGAAWLIAAATLLIAAPALAGDEQDPEILDGCDDGYVFVDGESVLGPPDAVNVKAAWFTGVWEPGASGGHRLAAVRITLQVCGELDLVPPIRPPEIVYAVAWDNAGCRQGIKLIRSADDPDRVDFRQRCGGEQPVRTTLPATDVGIVGDRLVLALDLDGPVATVTDSLVEGAVLAGPQAGTWFAVGEDGDGAAVTLEGDTSSVGRDFHLGQDKPPEG